MFYNSKYVLKYRTRTYRYKPLTDFNCPLFVLARQTCIDKTDTNGFKNSLLYLFLTFQISVTLVMFIIENLCISKVLFSFSRRTCIKTVCDPLKISVSTVYHEQKAPISPPHFVWGKWWHFSWLKDNNRKQSSYTRSVFCTQLM